MPIPLARLLLLALAVLLPGAVAATPAPVPGLTAVLAGPVDDRVRLTVQVPAGRPVPPELTVTVDGAPQPARVEPLLGGDLDLALVMDASAAGRPVLSAGTSGAANFLLALPPSARSTLVLDATPPAVADPLRPGPADTLRALAGAPTGGDRQTSAALELAVRQLPADPQRPRLVLLYTTAVDAGGEPPAELAGRLAAAGVVLAVVAAGPQAPGYWTAVGAGTGGVVVGTDPAGVIPAFDRVAAELRDRYLVTLPGPAHRPATAVVRLAGPDAPLTSSVEIPAGAGVVGRSDPGGRPELLLALVAGGLVLVAAGGLAVTRIRAARRGADRSAVAGGVARPAVAGEPPTPAPTPAEPRPAPAARPAADPTASAWSLPGPHPDPVDRAALLAGIEAVLRAGEPVVLLAEDGRAGVGRSTLLVEFAHRNRADYDIAWWVPAADPELIPDRLAELAEALGVAAPTEPAPAAAARLLAALRGRDRWLIVFDGADDPRGLVRWVPDGHGQVLLTAADAEWPERWPRLTVPGFTRVEAVGRLRAGRADLPPDAAALLAAAVDGLPLAVEPLGGLLAETDARVPDLLHGLATRPTGSAGPAGAALALAIDRLAAADPPAHALLTLLGWLGPAPVPPRLLTDHPELLPEPLADLAKQPAGLAGCLDTLRRRGLARPGPDGVRVHRQLAEGLVAGGSVAEVPRTDRARWAATAVGLLRAELGGDPAGPAARPAWRELLPLVLTATDPARPLGTVAAEVARLLAGAAGHLGVRGHPEAARRLLEDAHELLRRQLGDDHPETRAVAVRRNRAFTDPDADLSG